MAGRRNQSFLFWGENFEKNNEITKNGKPTYLSTYTHTTHMCMSFSVIIISVSFIFLWSFFNPRVPPFVPPSYINCMYVRVYACGANDDDDDDGLEG